MSNEVTFVLNGYKRGAYLREQIDACWGQSIEPKDVMLWQNNPGGTSIAHLINNDTAMCGTAYSNRNLGVWARFAYALMATTEWVCVLDDDTIPGRMWLENCLDEQEEFPGLYVTRGITFKDTTNVHHYDSHTGWGVGNDETKRVDYGGHAWFFKREWLADFWAEQPPDLCPFAGEDLHFSAVLQRRRGLQTYVPPHPKGIPDMWGSTKGAIYGNDKNAMCVQEPVWKGVKFFDLINDFFQYEQQQGWKLMCNE